MQHGRWNSNLIHSLFDPHFEEKILAIPINSVQEKDTRFWSFDPKGKYSVRNGYRVEIGCYDTPSHSSEVHSSKWWKYMWNLSIPPKLRIFWWRVMHDIIPTAANLRVNHVPTEDFCSLCKGWNESTFHALFWCPVVKICWKKTKFWPLLKHVRHLGTLEVILWMKQELDRRDFELFVSRTWAVWNQRLKIVHGSSSGFDVNSLDGSAVMIREFQMASLSLLSPSTKITSLAPHKWMAPPRGQLRMDLDVAYHVDSNLFAIGGAVREGWLLHLEKKGLNLHQLFMQS
ncbi:uncharacterized protein [Henckelia pumila]|uniref:uncharacterized protein n=1 Tax=Henckelia pumila TaxID=405737 RepID=UPI003C6DD00B